MGRPRIRKLTKKRLDVIPLAKPCIKPPSGRKDERAELQNQLERSQKYEQLASWLANQADSITRSAAQLDELLHKANKELGHGNATEEGRANAKQARSAGAGLWKPRAGPLLPLCDVVSTW